MADEGFLQSLYPSMFGSPAAAPKPAQSSSTGDADLRAMYPSMYAGEKPAGSTPASAPAKPQEKPASEPGKPAAPSEDLGDALYPSMRKTPQAPGQDAQRAESQPGPALADLQVPAGLRIADGDPVFADFRKAAGELGLDSPKASRLLELHRRSLEAARDANVRAWEDAARADTEIGGSALQTHVGVGQNLIKEFGTPALLDALQATGMGSNPELLRLLSRVGQALHKARGGGR